MSALAPDDLRWLDAAARIAQPYLGTTSQNPTVGALVVDPTTQLLLGRGVTAPGGRPHAEPQALAEAGEAARGATLYVTLEPCAHWGRTPPCADAVVRSGVARVVVGMTDPDHRTQGDGIARLVAAGIDVAAAHHKPSFRLHEGHIARHLRERPFVTAKLAVSADGKIGLRTSGNLAITGETARRWTHMQRALSDAVLIGAATARVDNPRLTVRLQGLEGRTGLRVVLAGADPLDRKVNLIASVSGYPVAVIATTTQQLDLPPTIEVIRVGGEDGRPDLQAALAALAAKGVGRLLVEGGAKLTASLLETGLVDRFYLLSSGVEVGGEGVPAASRGRITDRLEDAGLRLVDQRDLGVDKLRTYERT